MQIVIEIPDEAYNDIYSLKWVMSGLHSKENRQMFYRLINAVQGGTPLPEHHGRLIDADELRKNSFYVKKEELISVISVNDLIIAPTIIEADKGEQNARI